MQQPSSISERRAASTAMPFSLHNDYLCRVGAWSRTSHTRLTPDVRNLTGMQLSSRFLFWSFFVCFLTKEEQRSARTCTRSWNWSAQSKVYCRAGAALHCRSRLFARESSKCLLFVKARLNRRQAGRHCRETLSKCSCHEPRGARLTHTLSLFCFCVLVISKMSHGVNISYITQQAVAQGGYASDVVRNSQNTAWCCRKKLCIFSL